jgi:hypothetical protein
MQKWVVLPAINNHREIGRAGQLNLLPFYVPLLFRERLMTVISRRSGLLSLAACLAFSVPGIPSCVGADSTAGEITAEQWMSAWMNGGKDVSGALLLRRFKDPMYILEEPILWRPSADTLEPLPKIVVPKGFVTDLASIPRAFWSLLRPDGEYAYPAIIHDYLYWTQKTSREQADLILRLAMKDFEIDSATALTIYKLVRVGGASAWQANFDLKMQGERRTLKRFPEDPRVTWAIWKKESDVFADEPR